ncbi:PEP-CTERM sorting domain-containing protein [Limnofasciculus baicalensis]|uniref:PEP-CTERM sorting domain-containing protein n=1 Tax=Limnofasciculus baicalensis BBK-W-15 TaxID=2699891 RepID=A0AAE3KMF5_9CYAN|nr:PEP-CTERM sorting domain-containing protein [Limnofasciculus baicalensis]MCP2729435.1 PEP-CTERM sorting domain-containing protein [Limnofasciculus baicalensis BBK-W-15]
MNSNGDIGSASNVPDGNAYLGFNSDSSQGLVEFTFASDILRVGGLVTAANYGGAPANNIISLSAFDALNNLLETVTISGVNVSNWGSNFLGLENSGGIRKITISGDYTVLDKLTFEAAATQPVPEPASVLGLLTLGALGLGKGVKRKQ